MSSLSDFLEATVYLLPSDAGGRMRAVSPREGSYRPFLRLPAGGRVRVRFIEGPPSLAPGESGPVVIELESRAADSAFRFGAELELLEHSGQAVGLIAVGRLWRESA